MGVPTAVFVHFDYTVAGHIKVPARVVAVWQVVAREGLHECGVDALGGEHIDQLTQVRGLFIFVAGAVPDQPERPAVTAPFDDGRDPVPTRHYSARARRAQPAVPIVL